MLTHEEEKLNRQKVAASHSRPKVTRDSLSGMRASDDGPRGWAGMPRVEWLGQTAASMCWIASVLTYGISSTGDWLQLLAASAWLLANIAALKTIKAE